MTFQNIIKHPVVRFIITFISFFGLIYYFIMFYEGITAPGGYYVPFLDHYANFIVWYRVFLLESAHYLTNIIGYTSIVSDNRHLRVINGYSIQIVYSCLGFGLISVWLAFLMAYPSGFNKKITWSIIGFSLISLLNIIRISVIAIVATNIKRSDIEIHHTIYNVIVYIFIIIMIYYYTKDKKKKE